MNFLTLTLLAGPVLFMVLKAASFFYTYLQNCRKFNKLPHFPTHWLKGNMDMIKDFSSYFDRIQDLVVTSRIRMCCFWFGPLPVVSLTHPDTVQQLMKQNSTKPRAGGGAFISVWVGDCLLTTNGKIWERKRKLLTPAFHLDILKDYASKMNGCAATFVDRIGAASNNGRESIEIMRHLKRATLETILKCSLSCDDDVQNAERDHPYLAAVQDMCRLIMYRILHPTLFLDFIYKRSKIGKEMTGHLNIAHTFESQLIKERQQNLNKDDGSQQPLKRKPDFLDIVLQARTSDGQGLEPQEIHNEVALFTFAGHDTTMSSLTWAIYALGKHQYFQQLVYEEIQNVLGEAEDMNIEDIGKLEYLTCFVKEVLRFYSPVPAISREIDEPTVVDGFSIPIGTRVDIMIQALHHNPDVWQEPEEFRPERFNKENRTKQHPYAFIPFSAGKRNCIGQAFAMNEIKIFLVKLLQRYEITLDKDHVPIPVPYLVKVSENGVKIQLRDRRSQL